METLVLPRIGTDPAAPLEEIAKALEAEGVHLLLEELPWEDAYPYRPEVRLSLGHTGGSLCVRFIVNEQAVLAEKTVTNSQVSEDSCVELFIAPAGDGLYYNFEWNCIGTCLAGVGRERRGRQHLSAEMIERVRRSSTLGDEPFPERREQTSWSLVASLPASLFVRHRLTNLAGLEAAANFYKCGDHLSVPHYLAWNRIRSGAPDFHRPEQFGLLRFAP